CWRRFVAIRAVAPGAGGVIELVEAGPLHRVVYVDVDRISTLDGMVVGCSFLGDAARAWHEQGRHGANEEDERLQIVRPMRVVILRSGDCHGAKLQQRPHPPAIALQVCGNSRCAARSAPGWCSSRRTDVTTVRRSAATLGPAACAIANTDV